MRSTVNLRYPHASFEFNPDPDATERITFGQAIKVIDEVHRTLRVSAERISSAYFAIRRAGSTQKIASGRVVAMHSAGVSSTRWHFGHHTYNHFELFTGLDRVKDEMFAHLSGLAHLPFSIGHRVQVAPDKPALLVRIILLPTTPTRYTLIQTIRELIDGASRHVMSDAPPALDGLDVDSLQLFAGLEVTPVARLSVTPASSSSSSSSSGSHGSSATGGSSESRHGDVSMEME